MADRTKTSPERIAATERVQKALMLRKGGASYEDIAACCGYNSPQAAQKAVAKALRDIPKEAADELRQLQNDRLDQMLMGIWNRATSGHEAAIDRVLAIEARRSKMFGTDAPVKVSETDAKGNDKPHTGARELLFARLTQLAERQENSGSRQPDGRTSV